MKIGRKLVIKTELKKLRKMRRAILAKLMVDEAAIQSLPTTSAYDNRATHRKHLETVEEQILKLEMET